MKWPLTYVLVLLLPLLLLILAFSLNWLSCSTKKEQAYIYNFNKNGYKLFNLNNFKQQKIIKIPGKIRTSKSQWTWLNINSPDSFFWFAYFTSWYLHNSVGNSISREDEFFIICADLENLPNIESMLKENVESKAEIPE